MQLTLLFLDSFESEFKGKTYKVYRFIDPNTLIVINGTDLNDVYVPYKSYKCLVEFKNNKLKVIEAS